MRSRCRRAMWLLLADLAASAGALAASKPSCVDQVAPPGGGQPDYPRAVACSPSHTPHSWKQKTWKSAGWHDNAARQPKEWKAAARVRTDDR